VALLNELAYTVDMLLVCNPLLQSSQVCHAGANPLLNTYHVGL
jgi:hypothetical protein